MSYPTVLLVIVSAYWRYLCAMGTFLRDDLTLTNLYCDRDASNLMLDEVLIMGIIGLALDLRAPFHILARGRGGVILTLVRPLGDFFRVGGGILKLTWIVVTHASGA